MRFLLLRFCSIPFNCLQIGTQLPVHSACQVSVTVRLVCLSRASATRDAGHHSRCVQYSCLRLAAAAPALGCDGSSCGK